MYSIQNTVMFVTSFGNSGNFLLCLVLAWTAHGQFKEPREYDVKGNVTVISVQCTTPSKGTDYYEFTFELSNGEKLSRDGRLREVDGKKEVVMTGYVSEMVDGTTYWLRYVADENGTHPTIASRERASGKVDYENIRTALRRRHRMRRPPPQPPVLKLRFKTEEVNDLSSPFERDIALTTPSPSERDASKLSENSIVMRRTDGKPTILSAQSSIDPAGLKPSPCTSFSAGCIPKMDQILDDLMEKINYDKQIRPDIYEEPTQVWADFHIRALLGIDEVNMEFKMSFALTLDWIDNRLSLDGSNYPSNFVFPKRFLVDEDQAKKIWTPRVTILNEKESVEHSDIFDKGSLVWDPLKRQLTLTTYGVLTLNCEMSLHNFPMDIQICSAMIGSNFYDSNEICLTGNFKLDPIFSNSVKNMKLAGYGKHRIVTEASGSRGVNQTILVCDLLMKRHVGHYLIGTYFPAALVVIISWLTFWMPRDSSAERMALGVTCVLTITTLLISSQSSTPKVSYVKAIDIYMGVCFGLVFTTLLQSTLIGHWLRKGTVSDGDSEKCRQSVGVSERKTELASVVKRVMAGGVEMHFKAKILKQTKLSDAWSRALFPLVFVAFNLAYWTYYGTIWSELGKKAVWETPNATEIPFTEAEWFGNGEV